MIVVGKFGITNDWDEWMQLDWLVVDLYRQLIKDNELPLCKALGGYVRRALRKVNVIF